MDQAEGERVIRVGCQHAVAVGDSLTLAFGVVVDVGDERGGRRGATKVDVDLVEQVVLVVGWAIDAAVRRGEGERTVERVEATATGEAAVVRGWLVQPVHRLLVVRQQVVPARQQVTLEIVFLAGDHARAIIDLTDPRRWFRPSPWLSPYTVHSAIR